jgi:hypothetical protein
VAGSCEHGNEPSGSVEIGDFDGRLSDCLASQKDFVNLARLVC